MFLGGGSVTPICNYKLGQEYMGYEPTILELRTLVWWSTKGSTSSIQGIEQN
jgi:hypothetical protein